MAITTADGWVAAAKDEINIRKTASATTIAAQPFSLLDVAGNPGAGSLSIGNTANGLVPTDATAGFPDIAAFGGGATGYLAAAAFRNSVAGGLTLYDRVFHAGSFACSSLTTFNLASQPDFSGRLPGGSYANLEIFLEINAAMAASATTIAVGYTKEDGTTGRSTGASASLSGFTTRRLIPMPLQSGDKGVQKIESLTVGGATNASGTVNVIIARKLAEFDVRAVNALDKQGWDYLGAPIVYADSALWPVIIADSTSSGAPTLLASILNG